MKKLFTLSISLLFLSQILFSQALLTSELIGSRTKGELDAQFFGQTFLNGVKLYRVTYETKDLDGNTTIASGLVCIPDVLTKRYPLLCYEHGTAGTDSDVPSNLGFDADFAIAFSGKGYVAFAPDYLGMGVNPGIHPYVHAASEAWVSLDLLKATREFSAENDVAINDQLFITGYSQGGHSAMAFHRLLAQTGEFEVTAAAPMSGPYSIGEVMRDLIFSGQAYSKPGYLINTIVSYQYVYGDMYASIQEAFKPPYQNLVAQFSSDQLSLADMDAQLINLLNANEGAVIPIKMLNDDYVAAIMGNPNHPVNLHLKENNTYDNWVDLVPTRLYYCQADEQVPFENSTFAAAEMQAAGAVDVQAINSFAQGTHALCALFAPAQAITFFGNYQVIEDLTAVSQVKGASPYTISPNPANDFLWVKNLPASSRLLLTDLSGKTRFSQNPENGEAQLDLSGLQSGIYLLQIVANGQAWTEKVVKN